MQGVKCQVVASAVIACRAGWYLLKLVYHDIHAMYHDYDSLSGDISSSLGVVVTFLSY